MLMFRVLFEAPEGATAPTSAVTKTRHAVAELENIAVAASRAWNDRSDHNMMLLGQALTDED